MCFKEQSGEQIDKESMYSGSWWQYLESGISVLFGASLIIYLFSFNLLLVKFYNLATYDQHYKVPFLPILRFT